MVQKIQFCQQENWTTSFYIQIVRQNGTTIKLKNPCVDLFLFLFKAAPKTVCLFEATKIHKSAYVSKRFRLLKSMPEI